MIHNYNNRHITQNIFPIIFFRDLHNDVFHSAVNLCYHPQLDEVQAGQYIPRERWDPESMAVQSAQWENQDQPTDIASIAGSSDTELYDLNL